MRPDGSEVQRLTRTPEIAEDLSAWSADGRQLAFIARDDPVNGGVLFRTRGFVMVSAVAAAGSPDPRRCLIGVPA